MKIKFIFAAVLVASVTACAGGDSTSPVPKFSPDAFHGITVPPDPGAAGDATLAGVDTDANGIRDEVDRAIAQAYGGDAKQYAAAHQFALIQQKVLATDANNPAAALDMANKSVDSGGCLARKLADSVVTLEILHRSEALTFNTGNRRAQRSKVIAAAASLGVLVFQSPVCS